MTDTTRLTTPASEDDVGEPETALLDVAPSSTRSWFGSAFGADLIIRWCCGALGIAAVVGLWQLATSYWLTSDSELSPPSKVIPYLWKQLGDGEFWSLVGDTVQSWGIGLLLSVVIGIPAGILIGSNNLVWHALRPTLEFLRPIPGIALMPLALLLWGQTVKSAIFLVVFGTVWTLIVQALYGVRSVDQVAMDTGRVFGLGPLARVRWIILPSATPYLATGIRIASSVSLVIAVSAELLISSPGLGNEIGLSQSYGRYTEMYALILATGLLGSLLQILSIGLERTFLRWHESQRPKVTT